jgi:hypothetical protein
MGKNKFAKMARIIERTPGMARSIRLLVRRDQLPELE